MDNWKKAQKAGSSAPVKLNRRLFAIFKSKHAPHSTFYNSDEKAHIWTTATILTHEVAYKNSGMGQMQRKKPE